ncbi:MAG: hypothetical protein S0880_23235 [Actinomycetota bacterium]|nr:hypothetical protein [Actinomycetota bacterium]
MDTMTYPARERSLARGRGRLLAVVAAIAAAAVVAAPGSGAATTDDGPGTRDLPGGASVEAYCLANGAWACDLAMSGATG